MGGQYTKIYPELASSDPQKAMKAMIRFKQTLAASRDAPSVSSKELNLLIASQVAYQHKQVTGVPLHASLASSQDWRNHIRVSAIAKDIVVQCTEAGIAADLMLKCNHTIV